MLGLGCADVLTAPLATLLSFLLVCSKHDVQNGGVHIFQSTGEGSLLSKDDFLVETSASSVHLEGSHVRPFTSGLAKLVPWGPILRSTKPKTISLRR